MTEHTKEPWRQGTRYPSRVLADGKGLNVAATALPDDEGKPTEVELANARRIVACVNACAGLHTAELERIAALAVTLARVKAMREAFIQIATPKPS